MDWIGLSYMKRRHVSKKLIFWDFQGTLAYNDYMFSKVLYKVLIKDDKDTSITMDDFKRMKLAGFPWQDCEKKYNPKLWWINAERIFFDTYVNMGISQEKALQYARSIKGELIKAEDFKLYDDSLDVLKYFKEKGYTSVILSNHIPELDIIASKLGLDKYIDYCISSGEVGYEKPNPNIFKYALDCYENNNEIWMIGDNIEADVRGAEGMGLNAILVRQDKGEDVTYFSKDLYGVKDIIK